jgi:hypothetical protein
LWRWKRLRNRFTNCDIHSLIAVPFAGGDSNDVTNSETSALVAIVKIKGWTSNVWVVAS